MTISDSIRSYGTVLPLAILRILLGFMFLWAFLDKMFGLGYNTTSADAMINGGSPTQGFLQYGSETLSALGDFFAVTDVIIMAAFLLLGVALILGIGMKAATIGGTLLLIMMYIGVFPPDTNPLIDYHIIYIFLLLAIYLAHAEDLLGLGKQWKEMEIVKKLPILE
ncbi:MAG: thiosulfate dehydrogenase (quinone) large subunit [Candidatus Methanomethylophilaceae archaeon]|nr:thiosulfate dehydrogenase (quinone) large subunit [Candidatus Methanomethylophilaceae archaeon]